MPPRAVLGGSEAMSTPTKEQIALKEFDHGRLDYPFRLLCDAVGEIRARVEHMASAIDLRREDDRLAERIAQTATAAAQHDAATRQAALEEAAVYIDWQLRGRGFGDAIRALTKREVPS
jgi:hypothetical protein